MVPIAPEWLVRLSEASVAAEETQFALRQAWRDYAASPSQRNRDRLDRAARRALVGETEFATLWRVAAAAATTAFSPPD